MPSRLSLVFVSLTSVMAFGLGACTLSDEEDTGVFAKKPTASPTPGGTSGNAAAGSIAPDDPTPPPQQDSGGANTPTPTPMPTPTTLVAVKNVSVSPGTFFTLYPPAGDLAKSLGLPTRQQLMATVTLADGSTGTCKWIDLSEGNLNVDGTGLVTVRSGATPGLYEVQAQAVEDPNQSTSVLVLVKATTIVDVTIN